MRILTLCCCVAILSACSAAADDTASRVCPILEAVLRESNGKPAIAAQTDLIAKVAAAYEYKPEPLQDVLTNVDAATSKECPASRVAILKVIGVQTLEEAMR